MTEIGRESDRDKWINVFYVQRNKEGKLYIDGDLVCKNDQFPTFSTIFKDALQFNWLCRPPFINDSSLQDTLITDFRVYSRALDDFEVKSLASVTTNLDHEFAYGTPGDFSSLKKEIESDQNYIKKGLSLRLLQNALDEVHDEVNLAKKAVAEVKISQKIIEKLIKKMKDAMK